MSFDSRMISVQKELTGQGDSDLQDDTGNTVKNWLYIMGIFFKPMWPSPMAALAPRSKTVLEYAIASAVYEWAAIDWRDRHGGDKFQHRRQGPRFDDPPGKGASIGAFQGYAKESYEALRLYPSLRQDVRTFVDEFAAEIDESFDQPYAPQRNPRNGILVTGQKSPPGIRVLQGKEDEKLRKFLSNFDNLADPFISLVGKIKLSVDYATIVMMRGKRHIWRLPDAPLRHVMLVYECSGGDDDWLDRVEDIIAKADQVVAKARTGTTDEWRNANNAQLDFSWHFPRVPLTLRCLGYQNADGEKCRYHELRMATP